MSQMIYRDEQHAFDAVVKHLSKMKDQALNDEGTCSYYYKKNGEVRRCAIGGIMTIDQAQRLGDSWLSIEAILGSVANSELIERFQNVPEEFLIALQDLHDNADNWHYKGFRKSALREFAREYGLIYTPYKGRR